MSGLVKIISGGQTGVDRAALDAAIRQKIPHGGWCPRGRLAEDGAIHRRYLLRQTSTSRYSQRTKKNVLSADATLILCRGEPSGGTLFTKQMAERNEKPMFVVDLKAIADKHPAQIMAKICEWLNEYSVHVLNVAGPRESQSPGIYEQSLDFLTRLFED